MTKRHTQIAAAVLVAISVGSAGILVAQNAPVEQTAKQPAESTIKGIVQEFNLSPDGEPNGLLIKTPDGVTSQVNFPPHMATAITKAVKTGTPVAAETGPLPPPPPRPEAGRPGLPPPPPPPVPADRPPADHPVAELVRLTPDSGEAIAMVRPDELPTKKVEGTVARLNYAREGQVDGAVLDNGTFVHIGPKEATDFNLAAGQKLTAEGVTPPRATGNVIEATTVNGKTIERPRPDQGPGPMPGR